MRTRLLLCLSVFILPLLAHALGLGQLHVLSTLNEPLNAKAKVLGSDLIPSDKIHVTLASQEAFDAIGIDRPDLLKTLRFSITQNEGSEKILRVTSKVPLSESMLTFLIDMSWPKGQLYREYTVLLDPPPITHSATSYGPTTESDHLYKIASTVKHDPSVTLNQIMLAIFNKNPQAFQKKNINGLMQGYRLNLPTEKEMQHNSPSKALKFVNAQNHKWKAQELSTPVDHFAQLQQNDPITELESSPIEPVSDQNALQEELVLSVNALHQVKEKIQTLQTQIQNLSKKTQDQQEQLSLRDQTILSLQNTLTQKDQEVFELHDRITALQADLAKDSVMMTASGADTLQGNGQAISANKPSVKSSILPNPLFWIKIMAAILCLVLATACAWWWRRRRVTVDIRALAGDDLYATQLDLARTYVDMGNTEDARNILNNVLQKGRPSQQALAARLLEKLETKN